MNGKGWDERLVPEKSSEARQNRLSEGTACTDRNAIVGRTVALKEAATGIRWLH